MSYFVSPVLGMSLPNAGTNQTFEIAVQNANMALIEGGFTSDRTTLGTHTTQIATINAGSARGTLADFKVATPAALQALTGMVFGDTAVMAGDGTNFSQAVFQYNGSKWAAPVVQFLTAAGAMAAFTTYLLLGTNTNLIQTGGTGILNGVTPVQYGPNGWQRTGIVRPSVAPVTTGGTTTVNDDGTLTSVFTGAGTATTQQHFPTVAGYGTDGCEVKISKTAGTSGFEAFKLCIAGTPDASTTNYDLYGSQTLQTGALTPITALGGASWSFDAANISMEAVLELWHVNVAAVTEGRIWGKDTQTLGTTQHGFNYEIDHRAATAYDGGQLSVGAACTVNWEVRVRV